MTESFVSPSLLLLLVHMGVSYCRHSDKEGRVRRALYYILVRSNDPFYPGHCRCLLLAVGTLTCRTQCTYTAGMCGRLLRLKTPGWLWQAASSTRLRLRRGPEGNYNGARQLQGSITVSLPSNCFVLPPRVDVFRVSLVIQPDDASILVEQATGALFALSWPSTATAATASKKERKETKQPPTAALRRLQLQPCACNQAASLDGLGRSSTK